MRFYIDHGVIHDRETGKHVTTDGQPPFEDGIEQVCKFLNTLLENRVTISQQERAIQLALAVDQALSLVPQSTDGVEVAAADMLLLGPDISDFLRGIGGLPAYQRS